MSGSFQSKLCFMQKRKIKSINEFNAFMQNQGIFTQIRSNEANLLISKLQKDKAALEAVDASWFGFIQSITDLGDRAKEQNVYDLHVTDTKDQSKQSLLDSVLEIDDASSALENELRLIDTNLKVLNATNNHTVGQVLVINSPPSEIKRRLFNGAYKDYKPFVATFMAEYGNQPNIPDIIKLQKLKERLDGAAFDAVSRFNSDAGYAEALTKLKERFGRDRDAIEILRQELFHRVKNKNDLVAVRKAFDEFEGCISALAEFNDNITVVEFKMALERKVPAKILEKLADYERRLAVGTDPTVAELRKEVDQILMSCEKIYGKTLVSYEDELYCGSKAPRNVAVTVKQSKEKKVSNSSKNLQNISDKKVCLPAHFESPKKAKKFAAENHLCFKCFRQSHITKDCKIKLHCDYCNENHHNLNCPKFHINEVNAEQRNDRVQKENEKELLLMTAEVTVSNPSNPKQSQKLLALIDPGSDVSLIDSNVCKHLSLPERNEIAEFQTAFNQKSGAVGSVNLNLHLVDGTTVPVNSFKVKKLLENVMVPQASSQSVDGMPLPVTYDSPKLLLSVKEFQKYVMKEKISDCKNGFSSINSKLGRIIFGEGKVQFAQKHTVATVEVVESQSDIVAKEKIQAMVHRFNEINDAQKRRKNGRLKALAAKNAEKAALFENEPAPNLTNFGLKKRKFATKAFD